MAVKRKAGRSFQARRSSRIAQRGANVAGSSSQPTLIVLDSPTNSNPPTDVESDHNDGGSSEEEEEVVPEARFIHFRNLGEMKLFEASLKRNIVKGRSFVWKYLEDINFPFLKQLEEWGWKKFLTLNRPVYANIVKYFFFNGRLEKHDAELNPIEGTLEVDGFHTYLQGTHLRIDHRRLWKALGKPRHKPDGKKYNPSTYNLLEGAINVWGDDALRSVPTGMARVPLHIRILHLMVCHTINPRQGSRSKMTHEDIWLVDQIISKHPINLAAFVMQKLRRSVRLKGTKRGLLYGRVVSAIIDSFKIDGLADGELPNDVPIPFSGKTIRMTGFKQDKVTGEFVRGRRNGRDEDEGDLEMEDGEDSTASEEDVADLEEQVDLEIGDGEDSDAKGTEVGNGDGTEDGTEEETEDKSEEEREEETGEDLDGQEGGTHDAFEGVQVNEAPVEEREAGRAPQANKQTEKNEIESLRGELKAMGTHFQSTLDRLEREQKDMFGSIMEGLRAIQARVGIPVLDPHTARPQ